jgi:hypothetical protein
VGCHPRHFLENNGILDNVVGDRIHQRYALAAFYFVLGGPSWLLVRDFLDATSSQCKWTGVLCTDELVVTGFQLVSVDATGPLPFSLSLLSGLVSLDMEGNFSASIADFIGNSVGLTSLSLPVLFSRRYLHGEHLFTQFSLLSSELPLPLPASR